MHSMWGIQPLILGQGPEPSGSAQIPAWSRIPMWFMGQLPKVPGEGSAHLDLPPRWRLSLAVPELAAERGAGGLGWGHPCRGQVLLLEEAGPRVPAGD